MRRKDVLFGVATIACALAGTRSMLDATSASKSESAESVAKLGKPVRLPAHGPVNVALVMGPGLVAIDLFGPAAAFGEADMFGPNMSGLFNVYTVSANTRPIDAYQTKMQARYTFENAPQPNVLVVPMQDFLPATIAYIKHTSAHTDVTMSVCTGAFLVAKAGLFDGGRATTHHGAYDDFAKMFPKVTLIRGPRYVEDRDVSSSGGESSGIDLALRVVERYYGSDLAKKAAYNMEYRRTRRPQSPSDVGQT